jgi:hypothetical protein
MYAHATSHKLAVYSILYFVAVVIAAVVCSLLVIMRSRHVSRSQLLCVAKGPWALKKKTDGP